jgi:hypothetical protein
VIVEPQRSGQRQQHMLRWMALAPLLQPAIVIRADCCQLSHLFSAESRHPTVSAVPKAHLTGAHDAPSSAQEVGKLGVA